MMIEGHNLRVDGARLWDSLMDMAKIGGTEKGGCNRQALTTVDAEGRALFRAWCERLGCSVSTDGLGSMFARREGVEDLPPVVIGSHLDTQPTGGKFDGVLGVLAGLEVLRVLHETGIRTRRPIELVNWTNEEGCRFQPAMLASAVFAGLADHAETLEARDAEGIRLGDAMAGIGLDAGLPVGGRPITAYLELHIEQGPILEAEGADIGFVVIGQGLRWYDVAVTGFESHAGSTPMPRRKDALLAALPIIQGIREIALSHAPAGRGTVGEMRLLPNSRNVIPGQVQFSVDIRHPEAAVLARMDEAVRALVARVATETGLAISLTDIAHSAPVPFDPAILAIVREESAAMGLKGRDIVSGAGHDACNMARTFPSALIFSPCKDGVSHNEAEDMTPAWAEAGANVLLRTALRLANAP
ncbi:MAG: Zn-dependent hydrolase [Beijerinckiaceae bacterium]|nr:Zn-dependent hydrolase [Beijerinckiaceae bacterium]MCZ8299105.1 Zn-dependent hydrolase [Beijerinckiaceae bacterium]